MKIDLSNLDPAIEGLVFGEADMDWELSDMAHFINHSKKPNSELVSMDNGNKYLLVATDQIKPKTEITTDYDKGPEFVGKPSKGWK